MNAKMIIGICLVVFIVAGLIVGGRVSIKSPEDVKTEYAEMVRTAAEALSE